MKRIVLFFGLISLNAVSSEHEFKALVNRQNQQTFAMITIMGAIGLSKLFENSDQICRGDYFCLKLSVPVACTLVGAGALAYKKLWKTKGIV